MSAEPDRVDRSPRAHGEPAPARYRPPAIVWEQPFVALAQISPPPCDPDSDPNCQP